MNATEAINKIADLLGFQFKKETFGISRLLDGTELTNNSETEIAVGDLLYVIGDSTLTPAPMGKHESREGLVYILDEGGKVLSIAEKEMEMEKDYEVKKSEDEIENEKEEMMAAATLTDGTKIETDEPGDFKVGDKLYVITEAGDRVSAPEGEHTTESGITLTVDAEGFITGVKYPDESGEGSLQDFKKEISNIREAMSELVSVMKSYEKQSAEFHALKEEFEMFKKQPDREPVLAKFNSQKTDVLDYKLELLKSSRGINKTR